MNDIIYYIIGLFWCIGGAFSYHGLALVIIKVKYGKKAGKSLNYFLLRVLLHPLLSINYIVLGEKLTTNEINDIKWTLESRWKYLIYFAIINLTIFIIFIR
jgi:hypothetical protein